MKPLEAAWPAMPTFGERRESRRVRRVGLTGDEASWPTRFRNGFSRFSLAAVETTGSPWAFLAAAAYVVVWLGGGLVWGFGPDWQLWLNTGATFITFLMVFLIQHAQNRNTDVLQLKLDELLASHDRASNRLINLEDLSEEEIGALRARYQWLANHVGSLGGRGELSIDSVPLPQDPDHPRG